MGKKAIIPKRIDHVHIIDSVVEVRFNAKEGTYFLDLLASVKDLIGNYKFVANEIPKQIRQTDPQFDFSVEANFIGEQFSIGIGFNTIVFNCQNGYKTWDEFFPFIVSILERIGIYMEEIVRIGVRFTNFFEGENDLNNFHINFNAGSADLIEKNLNDTSQTVLKFATPGDPVSHNVTIANLAKVANRTTPGTLLDIDAYMDRNIPIKTINDLFICIEKTHQMEKEMFFALLKPDFLKTLNPQY